MNGCATSNSEGQHRETSSLVNGFLEPNAIVPETCSKVAVNSSEDEKLSMFADIVASNKGRFSGDGELGSFRVSATKDEETSLTKHTSLGVLKPSKSDCTLNPNYKESIIVAESNAPLVKTSEDGRVLFSRRDLTASNCLDRCFLDSEILIRKTANNNILQGEASLSSYDELDGNVCNDDGKLFKQRPLSNKVFNGDTSLRCQQVKINNNSYNQIDANGAADGMEEYFILHNGKNLSNIDITLANDKCNNTIKSVNLTNTYERNLCSVEFNGIECHDRPLPDSKTLEKTMSTTTVTTATVKGGTTREQRPYDNNHLNLLNGDDFEDEDGCIYTYKECPGFEDNLLDHLLSTCISCGLPYLDQPPDLSKNNVIGDVDNQSGGKNIDHLDAAVDAPVNDNLFSPDMDFLEMDFDPGPITDEMEGSDMDVDCFTSIKETRISTCNIRQDSNVVEQVTSLNISAEANRYTNNLSPEGKSLMLCRRCENDSSIAAKMADLAVSSNWPKNVQFAMGSSEASDKVSCCSDAKTGAISKKLNTIVRHENACKNFCVDLRKDTINSAHSMKTVIPGVNVCCFTESNIFKPVSCKSSENEFDKFSSNSQQEKALNYDVNLLSLVNGDNSSCGLNGKKDSSEPSCRPEDRDFVLDCSEMPQIKKKLKHKMSLNIRANKMFSNDSHCKSTSSKISPSSISEVTKSFVKTLRMPNPLRKKFVQSSSKSSTNNIDSLGDKYASIRGECENKLSNEENMSNNMDKDCNITEPSLLSNSNNNLGSLSAPEVSPAHDSEFDAFKRSISYHNQLSSPKHERTCLSALQNNISAACDVMNNLGIKESARIPSPLFCPNDQLAGDERSSLNYYSEQATQVQNSLENLNQSFSSDVRQRIDRSEFIGNELLQRNSVTVLSTTADKTRNDVSSQNHSNVLDTVNPRRVRNQCCMAEFQTLPKVACVCNVSQNLNYSRNCDIHCSFCSYCHKNNIHQLYVRRANSSSSPDTSESESLANRLSRNSSSDGDRSGVTSEEYSANINACVNRLQSREEAVTNENEGHNRNQIDATDPLVADCLDCLVLKDRLPPKYTDVTGVGDSRAQRTARGDCSCPRIQQKVMVWTERQANARQVLQLQRSSCGLTAVANVLMAMEHLHPSILTAYVKPIKRKEGSPLVDYLLSRSCAGTTHQDLIEGMTAATNGSVVSKFFSFYPKRAVHLSRWLAEWINKGGVCVCTLNLQNGVIAGETIPDAWHHQMVFGVGPQGIYLTNPVECVAEEVISTQLCSDRVLLVRREDVIRHWNPADSLQGLLLQKDDRWLNMNVLGQVSLVLKEEMSLRLRRPRTRGRQHVTSHVIIPASYYSGISVFMRADNANSSTLMTSEELPLLA